MMKKAVNYLMGSIRVLVECPYPERLVNICAQNDIEFWNLERLSPTEVHITMHISGFKRLRLISDKAGFSIRQVKKSGVPFLLWRLRKRYVLLVGMLVMFAAVWTLSFFVWEIEVYGNEKISSQQILESLRELGVGIGSFGPSVFSEAISNDMILKLPDLAWIAVNVSGSRAEVLVRERVPKPEILDEKAPTMVYAVKSGIIKKMSVLEGQAVSVTGDTVQAGDILVTGIMDSLTSGKRTVHAVADVYARTWYEMSARMMLETSIKSYTGNEIIKRAFVIAGNRINIYINGGIPFVGYDKITTEKLLRLPTGNVLPVAFISEKYTEYERNDAKLTVQAARDILEDRLLDSLQLRVGDGEVVKTHFSSAIADGVVTVTLRAECMEQIAAERSFTPEEIAQAQTPDDKKDETGN